MSATEELRALLDKRGVAWVASGFSPESVTEFTVNSITWRYLEDKCCSKDDPYCWLDTDSCVTPIKAIDAVIGPALCAVTSPVRRKTHIAEFCDNCNGAILPEWIACPWCGTRLVVDEDDSDGRAAPNVG